MRFYSLGILIPIGLLGNLVSTFVFISSKLRHKTAGQYFMALALANNVVLIGEACLWLNLSAHEGRNIRVEFMKENQVACQLVNFIRYLGRIWSSLIVMTISIERLVAIISPFKSEQYSTPINARIIIFLQLIFSTAVSWPIFIYVGIRDYHGKQFCYVLEDHYKGFLNWCLSGVVAFEMIVPGIVVTIVTGVFIYKLTIVQSRRKAMQTHSYAKARAAEKQANVTLIAVALAFLLLRPPYVITYSIHLQMIFRKQNPCDPENCSLYLAYGISYILAILNYSLNFLLYFVTARSFRKEFYSCLKCEPTGFSRAITTRLSSLRSFTSGSSFTNRPEHNQHWVYKMDDLFHRLKSTRYNCISMI